MTAFYNWDGQCLLRGTNWMFENPSFPALYLLSGLPLQEVQVSTAYETSKQ